MGVKRCILYAVSFVLMLAFCFSASALTDFSVNDFALWVNTPVADTLNAWQPDGSAGTDPLTVPDIRFCGFSGTLRFVSSDGVLWDTLSWYCDGGIKDTMAVIRDSIESAGAVFLRNEVPDVRGIERVYDIEGHMIRLGFTDEDGAVTYVIMDREGAAEEHNEDHGSESVLSVDGYPEVNVSFSITDPYIDPSYVRSEVPGVFPSALPAEEPAGSVPVQDPEQVSEPEEEPVFDVGEWVGYWSTRDDTMSEMVISSKGDGKLYVEASFLRTLKMNGRLIPAPDGGMRFESESGALNGTVTRTGDWMFDLTFTDGDSFNDEEASEYNAYFARTFRYEITPYDQMWYEESTDAVNASEDDWIGAWQAEKDGRVSFLNVTRVDGDLYMKVKVGNEYTFSGMPEKGSGNSLYFSGEEFSCDLTLSRKQGKIVMDEIGSSLDGVYAWLEPFYYGIVEYHRTESQPEGEGQETSGTVPDAITEEPASSDDPFDATPYITWLSNGNYHYDDGVISFDAPPESKVYRTMGKPGVSLWLHSRPEGINTNYLGEQPIGTLGLIPLSRYESFYDESPITAERIAQLFYQDGANAGIPSEYGQLEVAHRTAYSVRRSGVVTDMKTVFCQIDENDELEISLSEMSEPDAQNTYNTILATLEVYGAGNSGQEASEGNLSDSEMLDGYLVVRDLIYWVGADTDLLCGTFGQPSVDYGDQFVINHISFYGYDGYFRFYRKDKHSLNKLYWCQDDGSPELLLELCTWIEDAGGKLLRTKAPDYGIEYIYILDGRIIHAGHTDDGGPMTYVYLYNPEGGITPRTNTPESGYVPEKTVTVAYQKDEGTPETLYDVSFSSDMFRQSTIVFHEDLAKLSVLLAANAYNLSEKNAGEPIVRMYTEALDIPEENIMLFNYVGNPLNVDRYDDYNHLQFSIASRGMGDYILLLITIRGSAGPGKDERWALDWAVDANVGTSHCMNVSVHSGFNQFMNLIMKGLKHYIKKHPEIRAAITEKRMKALITGHSLGAGAANLLGAYLNSKDNPVPWVSMRDTFVYTFASPRTMHKDNEKKANTTNCANLFNIVINVDPVPGVPKDLFVDWRRFGVAYVYATTYPMKTALAYVTNHDPLNYIQAMLFDYKPLFRQTDLRMDHVIVSWSPHI